jgi:glyoxylase-like metal-dependent hydrolase (beta-lactamase superfamily II)
MEARIEQIAGETSADVNTWLIGDDDEVIVVDPGQNAAPVLDKIGDRDVLAVICTHGHSAHVAAALAVAEPDEAPVALHAKDRIAWRESHAEAPDIEMEDGGIFEVSDVALEVLFTPGHSPGSVCLYCEDLGVIFTGDVLDARGPVSHEDDFPDFSGQVSAIGAHVLTWPKKTRVLPGHGPELTVGDAEKKFDSWVTGGPETALQRRAEED